MVLRHHVYTDVELVCQEEHESWVWSIEYHLYGVTVDFLCTVHGVVNVCTPSNLFLEVLESVQRVNNVVCVELFTIRPVNSSPQVHSQLCIVAVPVPAFSQPRDRL